jgi:hypothetical protein
MRLPRRVERDDELRTKCDDVTAAGPKSPPTVMLPGDAFDASPHGEDELQRSAALCGLAEAGVDFVEQ